MTADTDQACSWCAGTGRGRTPSGRCAACHGTTVVHVVIEGAMQVAHAGPRARCDAEPRERRCKPEPRA